MRTLTFLSLLPLLASSSPILNGATVHQGTAPILSSVNSVEVADSYIVVFKKHLTLDDAAIHHDWVQNLHLASENSKSELRKRSQLPLADTIFEGLRHTYNINGGLLGYSGHFHADVIEQVRRHPDVI